MDKGDPPRRPRSAAPDTDDIYQIDPRRKYKRRATDSLSELKDSGSENESRSSMSESEEHEMGPLGSDVDVDEETGLTGKERQKYLQRKRRRDDLDSRIAGGGGISKEEARQADRNVVRNLLFNACLIGLWYLFSLSISIVRIQDCQRPDHRLTFAVQQMDVLQRPPRLPLPPLHHLPAYDRSIPPRLDCPTHLPISPPALSTTHSAQSTSKTSRHCLVLPHPARPNRHHHLPRHWPRQHLITLHYP